MPMPTTPGVSDGERRDPIRLFLRTIHARRVDDYR